jgi:type I restriction-modification system DNA methylase subunit
VPEHEKLDLPPLIWASSGSEDAADEEIREREQHGAPFRSRKGHATDVANPFGEFEPFRLLRRHGCPEGDKEIGDKINKIIAKLAEANDLQKLVSIFADLDFRDSHAGGDDLLGDVYEYLIRRFATESGKSKGQFYTPAEVSRILAKVVGVGPDTEQDQKDGMRSPKKSTSRGSQTRNQPVSSRESEVGRSTCGSCWWGTTARGFP